MKLFLFFTSMVLSTCTYASDSDSTKIVEIEAVIHQLFRAMREGDSTSARLTFHPDARLMSTFETKKGPVVRSESIDNFISAIGTPHEGVWDERTSNLMIQVDGTLAQAWMNYRFYLDADFSHCGVNAMQFVYGDHGWQIIQALDTRRKENCAEE